MHHFASTLSSRRFGRRSFRHARSAVFAVSTAALSLGAAACEVVSKDEGKQDTTTLAPRRAGDTLPAVPRPPLPGAGAALSDTALADTTRAGRAAGVPAVPSDSMAAAARTPDSGVVQLHPAQPRRGGVLFALAEGLAVTTPRCSWDGSPVRCYSAANGVVAVIPLSADQPAGAHTLAFERPSGQLTRRVTVADREFERELIFLTRDRYALLERGREIARDGRALRAALSAETPTRQWRGRWRDPVPMRGATNYGVERLYYPASDSSRAVTLSAQARIRGSFAADTVEWRPGADGDAPGWRHSGVDVPVRRGTPVTAPAGATVADVGDYVLTGRTVLLDHGQGIFSAYFHLDTAVVRRGDVVRAGTVVGRSGDTGLSTGPHLHYAVYVHGTDVDPVAWRDMPSFMRADSAAGPRATSGGPAGSR
jgi:murein DD-endopeptidase MepM/ murein hydrolase activator NlpD